MHLFLKTLYLLTVMVTTALLMLVLLLSAPDVHYRLSQGLFRPAAQWPQNAPGSDGADGPVVSAVEKEAPVRDRGPSEKGPVKREVAWDYTSNNTGFLKLLLDYERPQHAVWGAEGGGCGGLRVRFGRRHSLPRTALASYPGSGNTWLRYLLESSTGLFTGSIYSDSNLAARGFYGESEGPECGCTIAVKTHGYCLLGLPVDRSIRLRDQDRFYGRALLLLRNPFDSIIAYRNYQTAGHLGVASPNSFRKEDWNRFVKVQILTWRSYALDWLIHGRSVEVIHFELLQEALSSELQRMLWFLRVRPDPQRLQCVLRHPQGAFKRVTPHDAFYRTRDPFSGQHHELLESAMHDVNNALARRGLRQLPMHLYRYRRENEDTRTIKENPSVPSTPIPLDSRQQKRMSSRLDRKFSRLGVDTNSIKNERKVVPTSDKVIAFKENSVVHEANPRVFRRSLVTRKETYNPNSFGRHSRQVILRN